MRALAYAEEQNPKREASTFLAENMRVLTRGMGQGGILPGVRTVAKQRKDGVLVRLVHVQASARWTVLSTRPGTVGLHSLSRQAHDNWGKRRWSSGVRAWSTAAAPAGVRLDSMVGTQATASARRREASSHKSLSNTRAWPVSPPRHDDRHTE
jgi:hypothetical protein